MADAFADPMRETAHRPWPVPQQAWVMAQRWSDLLFMHWPVPAESLRALIPAALRLDTYEGSAWVSVTPFYLSHLRARGLPALPWLSEFPELNVRTYVVLDDKPGVFFFSLDAGSMLAVIGARTFYRLPYHTASMRLRRRADGGIDYESRRLAGGTRPAVFKGSYSPAGPVTTSAPGSLEHWLSERYCLYAVGGAQRIYRADIHHLPWPLQRATVDIAENTMAAAAGIELPPAPPIASFARQLDVVIWAEERVR